MDRKSLARKGLEIAKGISLEAPRRYIPPREPMRPESEGVLPADLTVNTRGYLDIVTKQINGTYERGWYDACAVMMRRLLETLIIEAFETHGIAAAIKHQQSGDFLPLADLVGATLQESSWNLGRNSKKALPKLKKLGDLSAHSRRYNARRDDVDRIREDFRLVCEELLYVAGLK
jgi:hypothetical protein